MECKKTEIEVKKRHQCTFEGCDASFGRPDRLEQHLRVHTGERPFKCTEEGCDRQFTRASHLKRHIQNNHTKVFATILKCPVDGCSGTFASEQNLRRHHERFHMNDQSNQQQNYSCDICSANFKKHQTLKNHLFEHTGVKPFKCDAEGCDMSFLKLSNLKAHTKVHAGYSCDVKDCEEHFPTWSALRKHKADEHAKIHDCSTCGKVFKRASFLNVHLETHKPNREVFHCPIDDCQRWYYLEKNLRQHIRMYHTPGQFKCEVEGCGAQFLWKASLKSHTARHNVGPQVKTTNASDSPRKVRSDKGQFKKSMAVILSGLAVSKEENDRLLKKID